MAWNKAVEDSGTVIDWGVVPVSGTAARTTVITFNTSTTSSALYMGGWGSAAAGTAWRWRLDGSDSFAFRVEVASGAARGATTKSMNDGVDHTVAFGVAASADINEMVMYIDGVSQSMTTSQEVINTGTDNDITVGFYTASSTGIVCEYSEVAVYDRLLSAGEMIILTGTPATPASISRGRVFYAPMVRQLDDISGGAVGTESGVNGSIVAHPPVLKPFAQILQFPPAAVGGATPKYPLGLPLYGPFRGPIG